MARPRKRSKADAAAAPRSSPELSPEPSSPLDAAQAVASPPERSGERPDASPAPIEGAIRPPPTGAAQDSVHARRDARALLVAVVVVATTAGVVLGRGPLPLVRMSAWAALLVLLAALACSPLAAVARRAGSERARRGSALVVRARRGIGVAAFALATLHAGLAFALHLGTDVVALASVDRLRHGALALALLLPLALTSSGRVLSVLRLRSWKALHRAAYPAAILAIAHAFRAPHAPAYALIVAAGGLALLLAARPVLLVIRGQSTASAPGSDD